MKRKYQTLIALATTSVVAASLASCSASTAADPGQSLTMWTYSTTGAKGLNEAAKQYKAKTGVTVKVEVTAPREAYITKIQAAARSKSLPDIITVGAGNEDFTDAAATITIDLSKYVDATWKKSFLPGMVTSVTLTQTAIDSSKATAQTSLESLKAGHIYSVPYLAGSSGVIVANKKLLAAAGVSTDVAPQTWEDLVAGVKKTYAHDAASGGIINGLQTPEGAYQWLYRPMAAHFLGQNALVDLQTKNSSQKWTSEAPLNTFELYNQLQPYWAKGVLALGLPEADTAFAQGQAAWDVGGTYTIPSVVSQGLKLDDLLMFPVPPPNGSKQSTASISAIALLGAAVTTQSKNQKTAVDFIKYLTTETGALAFANGAGDVPATQIPSSKISDPILAKVIGSLSTDLKNAFNPDDTSADPAATPPIKHNVALELAKLVDGSATPKQVAVNIEAIYRAAWNVG